MNAASNAKKKIALAAVLLGLILTFLTFSFMQEVRKQLWEQSAATIMESTLQGCNTLKIQLSDDYASMNTIAESVGGFSAGQGEQLEEIIADYAQVENGVTLFLEDGTSFPAGTDMDEEAERELSQSGKTDGIIDPHISSVTGVNVFDLYIRTVLQDGTVGWLLKEYEVDGIVDSFSLSFYHDTGFSYVINTKGDVLIRPPHPNSNKTVQNLFDMLPEGENDPSQLSLFAQSLKEQRTGTAVFSYQGEDTVFCYTPVSLQSDWYLISIIPERVVNAQSEAIVRRALTLIGCILLGIILLALFYLRYAGRANRKLVNQAEYIRHLYNAVPEGIGLITAKQPHHMLRLNREGLNLLGYPEGTDNSAPDGMPIRDMVHPDDYARTIRIFEQVSESGQKSAYENRLKKTDGTFFWASGIIEKTLDENGMPVLIAAFHDISDMKLAEAEAEKEKLQERITLVSAISNAYPVIISMNLTRDTLNFTYVKQGLMLGVGAQKSYSELFEDISKTVHPDEIDEYRRRLAPAAVRGRLGKERKEIFMEARQMLSDGIYHWTSTQIIRVDNPYSGDELAVLISRRIDEQRHEEERQRQVLQSALDSAKAASNAKTQFLSNMSHDIRTPMNAIVGMTGIAAAHVDDRERVAQCLKKIGLSSRHLLSLLNDILDMSKIESGKMSLGNEPFNYAELVSECAELIRTSANEKQIEVTVHLSALKNENVVGDPLRIRQICLNILSNAVKYTPEGGKVLVEARQEHSLRRGYQSYVFKCTDNGVGMNAEFLSRLYQPFERVQDSTNSRVAGTGLGMAITKNLTDLMSGDIQVESRPGEGTTFTVTLPLRLQDVEDEAVPEEWIGVRSMIIDDDKQICENAAELFTDMGLRPSFFTEGRAAVEYIAAEGKTDDPFRLVIVDWKMPDMDGIEVAARIRQEVGPEVPVIVLTAYDWAEIEGEARAAGVTAFLSKPFYRTKVCYLLSELSGENADEAVSSAAVDYTGKRVLLVEDNELNREIVRELIGEMGAQIEEAVDGEEAVKAVSGSAEGYYDLILMDIQMPKMDGYEATKAIRAMDRSDARSVPIIAMTANAFEEDVRLALHAGMNAHLAKPIDTEVVWKTLNRYLMNK